MSMEGDACGGLDAAIAYAWEVGLTRKEIEEQVHYAINREEQERPCGWSLKPEFRPDPSA